MVEEALNPGDDQCRRGIQALDILKKLKLGKDGKLTRLACDIFDNWGNKGDENARRVWSFLRRLKAHSRNRDYYLLRKEISDLKGFVKPSGKLERRIHFEGETYVSEVEENSAYKNVNDEVMGNRAKKIVCFADMLEEAAKRYCKIRFSSGEHDEDNFRGGVLLAFELIKDSKEYLGELGKILDSSEKMKAAVKKSAEKMLGYHVSSWGLRERFTYSDFVKENPRSFGINYGSLFERSRRSDGFLGCNDVEVLRKIFDLFDIGVEGR